WALGHVGEELRLVARRFDVLFFEIRNSPVVPGHDKPPTLALMAGMAWMAAMRGMMWSAIVVAALAVCRGANIRLVGLCCRRFGAAYVVPCLVAYAYERHVVPIILPAALFLASAWRLRAAAN